MVTEPDEQHGGGGAVDATGGDSGGGLLARYASVDTLRPAKVQARTHGGEEGIIDMSQDSGEEEVDLSDVT